MTPIATPEISWLAIAPELILALGAVAVLLVDVQWKPRPRVHGYIAAITIVLAAGLTAFQWTTAADAGARGDLGSLVAFSGMITMDGFAVFSRFALLVATALGLSSGWRFIAGQGRRGGVLRADCSGA